MIACPVVVIPCVYSPLPVQLHRGLEMRTQLGIKDKEGMTVAMHAAKSGNVATVSALIAEIELAEVSSSAYGVPRSRMIRIVGWFHTPILQGYHAFAPFQELSLDFAQASFALVACDYKQTTLIMHAASEGNAPIFREVQQAIRRTFKHDVEVSNTLFFLCCNIFSTPQPSTHRVCSSRGSLSILLASSTLKRGHQMVSQVVPGY